VRRLTYGELHEQVQRFANVLKGLGVNAATALLSTWECVRTGDCAAGLRAHRAVHSVIFGDSPLTRSQTA